MSLAFLIGKCFRDSVSESVVEAVRRQFMRGAVPGFKVIFSRSGPLITLKEYYLQLREETAIGVLYSTYSLSSYNSNLIDLLERVVVRVNDFLLKSGSQMSESEVCDLLLERGEMVFSTADGHLVRATGSQALFLLSEAMSQAGELKMDEMARRFEEMIYWRSEDARRILTEYAACQILTYSIPVNRDILMSFPSLAPVCSDAVMVSFCPTLRQLHGLDREETDKSYGAVLRSMLSKIPGIQLR